MHKNLPPAAFIAYFSFGIEKLHTAQCKESYAACLFATHIEKCCQHLSQHALVYLNLIIIC